MNFLRHFTAAIFSIHALIGCCWHHAHVCEGGRPTEGGVVQAEAVQDEHESHSHHGGWAAETSRGEPCDDSQHEHACEGDRCVFVRAEAVQLPPMALGRAVLADIVLAQTSPSVEESGRDLPSQGGWRGVSLRPHLMYQVLLI